MSRSDYRSPYDRIFIDDIEYTIVDCNPTTIFDPRPYGLKPYRPWGCKDGEPFFFVCVYRIRQKCLCLERLGVRTVDDSYPEIQGCQPIDGRLATIEGSNVYLGYPICSPEFQATDQGGRFYHLPDFRIPYSGTMWLGFEYPCDRHISSYWGAELAYKKVLEIQLEDGVLIASRDWSAEAMQVRSAYAHVSHLLWDGLLTSHEHELLVPREYLRWTEVDVLQLERTIRDIERATYTPIHFVSLFTEQYASIWQEDLPLLLSLEWFAARRFPGRIRRTLRLYIGRGYSERVVLAHCLKHLLVALGADAGHKNLMADLDEVIAEGRLPEQERTWIYMKMRTVKEEAWDDGEDEP